MKLIENKKEVKNSSELKNKNREELELEASKKLKTIHTVLYNGNFTRAESLLNEAMKLYKDVPDIVVKFEIKNLALLIKQSKYENAIKNIESLKEKYKGNTEIIGTLESIKLKAYLGLGEYETIINEIPELIKKFPEKAGFFQTQKMEVYLRTGREEYVAQNSLAFVDKYPKIGNIFLMQRLRALILLGRYEEAYSINTEDIRDTFNRNDIIKFGRLKVEALIKDGKINEALQEINSLRIVYHARKTFFNEQIDMMHEKIKEIKNTSLDKLIETDEENFMKYAKNIDMKHFTFLQVARYKYEKRNNIAMATIEEYKKRSGENVDLDFVKELKKLAEVKKKPFDFMKWITLSKKLNLTFDKNMKEIQNIPEDLELN